MSLAHLQPSKRDEMICMGMDFPTLATRGVASCVNSSLWRMCSVQSEVWNVDNMSCYWWVRATLDPIVASGCFDRMDYFCYPVDMGT